MIFLKIRGVKIDKVVLGLYGGDGVLSKKKGNILPLYEFNTPQTINVW